MPVIIVIAGILFVGAFVMLFNQIYSAPAKKIYYDLLSQLEENPDDEVLKEKAMTAGRKYNDRITILSAGNLARSYSNSGVSEEMIKSNVNDAILKGKNGNKVSKV